MDEHRVSHRRRTLKEGRVILSDWTVVDCTIRDMSDTGARIELGGLSELPKEVRLLVVSTNLLIPAEVAWQRGQAAGLHFTGPGQPHQKRA